VEAGYLLRNPCTVEGAGQERAPEMRFATVAQVQVAALAEAIDARYGALVLVAAGGGLRWGELVGLKVKRVDLLHGRVSVAEQVAEVNGRHIPGPPKTEAGRRTVTLAVAAAALAEHLANFAEHLAPRGWCSRRPGWLPAPLQLPRPLVAAGDPSGRCGEPVCRVLGTSVVHLCGELAGSTGGVGCWLRGWVAYSTRAGLSRQGADGDVYRLVRSATWGSPWNRTVRSPGCGAGQLAGSRPASAPSGSARAERVVVAAIPLKACTSAAHGHAAPR
jgi:hypothetical protein